LSNISYRQMTFDVTIHGNGSKIKECSINGNKVENCFLPADGKGHKAITITVGDS
jgi:hypothetical protein